MASRSTPDPNLETTAADSIPPPPPRKDADQSRGDDRVTKNLGPSMSDAASSSESDPVAREHNLAELHRQVAFLQGEIIRQQAKESRKKPVGATKKSTGENPKVTPSKERIGSKPQQGTVLPPGRDPPPPRIDIVNTETPEPTPRTSLRKTPPVRKRKEYDYDEDEGDSDYPPPKRTQMQDMRELIRAELAAAKQTNDDEDPSSDYLSPLSSDILNVRFPKKFVSPSFKCYDGTTDPLQHLRHFQDRTAVYSYDDALLCRMFPSSLEGRASDWFYSLKPESLHTFKEIIQAFKTQYSSCREYKKNRNHLFTMKMAEDETLKSYLARFQAERASIINCGDDVAAAAFISGLHVDHKFYSAIVKGDITEMKDILRLAPGYIQLEEVRRSKKSVTEIKKSKTEPSKAPGGKETNPNGGGRKPAYTNLRNNFDNQQSFQQNVRESVYNIQSRLFNTPINEILRVIKDQPWVRKPPALPDTTRNANSPHFCSYHQANGHKTVNCRALVYFLKELLEQGYLKEYALSPEAANASRGNPHSSGSEEPQAGKGTPQYKIINSIYGASAYEASR